MAEERRRQAIAEIMERGRMMEERSKRRKLSAQERDQPPFPTFDTLVDNRGILLQDNETAGLSTGFTSEGEGSTLRNRTAPVDQQPTMPTSDAPLLPAHPDATQENAFESKYEREMREAWNLPLSNRRIEIPPSHASESLIDLTPTTESAPDPDFSIPSAEYLQPVQNRSEYFSAVASASMHTLSDSESLRSAQRQNLHLNSFQNGPAMHQLADQLPGLDDP